MNLRKPVSYHLLANVNFKLLVQHTFENEQDEPSIAFTASLLLSTVPSSSELQTSELLSDDIITSPLSISHQTVNTKLGLNMPNNLSRPSRVPGKAQKRSKSQSKKNCQKKHATAKEKSTPEAYLLPPMKRPCMQEAIVLDVTLDQFWASGNSFTSYHTEYISCWYSLEDVAGPNSVLKSDIVLITRDGYKITHGISIADEKTWPAAATRLADKLDAERSNTSFTGKLLSNCHGNFYTLLASISCDRSMKKPNIVGQANAKNAAVIKRLLQNTDAVQLAGFQSLAFCCCQPILY
uniref:Uncharacterized protein n=1 Tax=Moniliophthora roreri TaxID=221103 RepID=A0A0W0FG75_MONRR